MRDEEAKFRMAQCRRRTARLGALLFLLLLDFGLAAAVGDPGPGRIVSLTPSVTETLFALDVGDRVVGVSTESDEPPACRRLPQVGTFLAPVVERVLSLEPDLVITSPSPGNRSAVLAIERAGIRTAVVSEGSGSLDDVRASIAETAAAVGRPEEGRALIDVLETALAEVKRRVSGRERRRTAVIVGLQPLILAGRDSYLGELVTIGGGANVADAVAGKWPHLGWEFLVSAAPEVVIDVSGAEPGGHGASPPGDVAGLAAAGVSRVYRPSGDMLLRPGPRVARAAVEVAKAIHPEAWEATH